jgi:N-acetylneuraminic acid mutarotase
MKRFVFIFLSLAITFSSFGQMNQWAWVSGDSAAQTYIDTTHTIMYNFGAYGIKGIASAINKPGGRDGSISWKDVSGNLWLLGGYGYAESGNDGELNDLWKYNINTEQWTWVNGDSVVKICGTYGTKGIAAINNKPGARYYSVSWTDVAGNLWLFGGSGYPASIGFFPSGGNLDDLWKYNITTAQWTWISGDSTLLNNGVYGIKGTASPINKPGGRSSSVSWTDTSNNLWLFGGYGYATVGGNGNDYFLNDLWKYNTVTGQWTWVSGDSAVWVYGIYGTKGIATVSNKPGSRYGSVSWSDALGNLWLFGGNGAGAGVNNGLLNDLWKYNTGTGQWTWISGDSIGNVYGVYGTKGLPNAANKPGSRNFGLTWIDASGNLWLFGGFGYGASISYGELNDLWKYNINTGQWTWVNGDNSAKNFGTYGTKSIANAFNTPGSRNGNISWIDSLGNQWLFGGNGYASTTSGYLNDLWKITEGEELCGGGSISFTSDLTGISYQWQLSTDHGITFNNISNNVNYAGTSKKTITITSAPSSWYSYKYRCVVGGSHSMISTLVFTNYWTGAVNSAWENPANWSCGTVPDNYTDVYIPAGAVVTINSNNTIATLHLDPTASLTVNPPYTLTLLGH